MTRLIGTPDLKTKEIWLGGPEDFSILYSDQEGGAAEIKVVQLKQESAKPEISISHQVLSGPVLGSLLPTEVILQVSFVPRCLLIKGSHPHQISQRGALPYFINSSPRNLTAIMSKPICIWKRSHWCASRGNLQQVLSDHFLDSHQGVFEGIRLLLTSKTWAPE